MQVPGHAPGSRMTVPPEAIAWACAADPELAPVLLALAGLESGFNPQAVANTACPNRPGYRSPTIGLPEYSVGLLQHNMCGGLGGSECCAGDPTPLMDPVENLRRGAAAIREALAAGASLPEALRPWLLARDILLREGYLQNLPPSPCGGEAPGPWEPRGPIASGIVVFLTVVFIAWALT